jgi:hypothetical protein
MSEDECSKECCSIPVCLNFVEVCATEEFKDAMKELFSEIFSDLCGGDSETTICHMPGTPAEKTMTVPLSALQAHLDHGDTLGACEAPVVEVESIEVDDVIESIEGELIEPIAEPAIETVETVE